VARGVLAVGVLAENVKGGAPTRGGNDGFGLVANAPVAYYLTLQARGFAAP